MTALTLIQVPGTALYQPPQPPGAYFAFLLADAANPPPTIAVTDTWSELTAPKYPGWYVFLQSDAAADAALEQALTTALGKPKLTSFAWADYTGGKLDVLAMAPVVAGSSGRAVLASDAPVTLPAGMRGLVLPKGAEVFATQAVDAFVFTYPPDTPGASPPRPAGVSVALTGSAAGCLSFSALVNASGGAGAGTRKALVSVQLDPDRPFDSARTFQAFTGRELLLVDDGGSYRLEPA
jgi:hypothetical protein